MKYGADPPGSVALAFAAVETMKTPNMAPTNFAVPKNTLSKALLPYLLIAMLVVILYIRIFLGLAADWYRVQDVSYGYLVPLFVLYLLWDQRADLRCIPVVPAWRGLWLVLGALLVLLVGQLGASEFLSRISFVCLAGGIVWTLWGGRLLNRMKFILFACLLGVPLPGSILARITSPLQFFSSDLVSALLPLAGVPVFRTGNVIQLPALQLEVAEACSGIRSLMSLLTLAIIFGYLAERTMWQRIILALASIPVAVASNVLRIFLTGICVQYWDPEKAKGFFHEFSGWVMFVISVFCLYGVHKMIGSLQRRWAAA